MFGVESTGLGRAELTVATGAELEMGMAKIQPAVNALRLGLGAAALGLAPIGTPPAFSMTDSQCSTIKLLATEKPNRWQSLLGEEVPTSNRPGAPFQRQSWKAKVDGAPFKMCYIREKTYRGGEPVRSASCHVELPPVPEKVAMTTELQGRLFALYTGLAGEFARCLGSKPRESTGTNDSATSRTLAWEWKLSPPQVPQPVTVTLSGAIPNVGAVVDGIYTSAHFLVSFD